MAAVGDISDAGYYQRTRSEDRHSDKCVSSTRYPPYDSRHDAIHAVRWTEWQCDGGGPEVAAEWMGSTSGCCLSTRGMPMAGDVQRLQRVREYRFELASIGADTAASLRLHITPIESPPLSPPEQPSHFNHPSSFVALHHSTTSLCSVGPLGATLALRS